jgi:hypothetical protein
MNGIAGCFSRTLMFGSAVLVCCVTASAAAKSRNTPEPTAAAQAVEPESSRLAPGEFSGPEILVPPAEGRARARKPSPLKSPAYLFVETVPETADIRIDGSSEGRGRVSLRLRGDRLVALAVSAGGYENAEGYVELREGEVTKLRLILRTASSGPEGLLTVLTEPSGAEVTVDNSFAGTTPITVRRLSEGRHEVSLRSGSWYYNESAEIRSGQPTLVSVPVGASAPVASAPAPQPAYVPAPQPAYAPVQPVPAYVPPPAQPAPVAKAAVAPQPAPVAVAAPQTAPAPQPAANAGGGKPNCGKICEKFIQPVSDGAREPIRNLCSRRCDAGDMAFSVCAWKVKSMSDVLACGNIPDGK